jgi:hypothetical protein
MDTVINTGVRVQHLVYIAGVKVPCMSLNMSASDAGQITASITLPPSDLLLELGNGDRTQVAAFYLDSWKHNDDPSWCLLFEGYIAGVEYSHTPTARSVIIHVSSNYSVLGNLYLEFLGGGETSSGKVGKPGSAIPNEITFKGKFPGQLFTVGLDNKNEIRAPYELVQNILLATTGTTKDKDLAKPASKDELTSELSRISSLVELNYSEKTSKMSEAEKLQYDKEQRSLLESRSSLTGQNIDTSKSIVDIQKALISSEVTSLLKKRSLNARTPVSSGFFSRFFNLVKLDRHLAASPVLEGFIYSFKKDTSKPQMPTGVFPMLRTSRGRQYLKSLARQSGFKYGDNGSAKSLISNLFTIFNYSITEIPSPPIFNGDDRGLASGKFDKNSNSNILAGLISKPSTNYSVPPACNVIFPSMRVTLQANSSYEGMPTRVYFQKTSQGRKLNLDSKTGDGYAHMDSRVGYPAAIARHAMDSAKAPRSELEVLVFPEEYYAGPKTLYKEINPLLYEIDKLEKASRLKDETPKITKSSISALDTGFLNAENAAFAREAFISAKNKGQNNYDLYLKQAKIDYDTSRSANFTCNVSTVFNPYIVPGFSALVLDTEDIGGHIIGHVASVSHSITTNSSSTTISLVSARKFKSVLEGILLDGGAYDMSPLEPISEVRAVLQKIESANFYYSHLLYRDSEDKLKDDPKTLEYFEKLTAIRNKQVELEKQIEILETKGGDESNSTRADLELKIAEYIKEADSLILDSSINGVPDQATSKAVCDYRKLLAFKLPSNSANDAKTIEISTGKLLRDIAFGQDSAADYSNASLTKEFHKLRLVYANDKAREIANSYRLAMDYVSRPVCTIEQYIDFYKQSNTPNLSSAIGGRGRGCRIKPIYTDELGTLAKHYEIIREFVGGPGVEPGSKRPKSQAPTQLSYYTEGPSNSAIKATFTSYREDSRASVTDLPDTIKDWQELLLDYIEQLKQTGVIR